MPNWLARYSYALGFPLGGSKTEAERPRGTLLYRLRGALYSIRARFEDDAITGS